MCGDNRYRGNFGVSSMVISFQEASKPCITVPIKSYFILASGSSGTEIPRLNIKELILDKSNKLAFR